jgi:hypothetical protein
MKIEVLYFEGCPNSSQTVERVKDVLREEGLRPEVSEVNITDEGTARAVGFLGSPSVRIDGIDIEPDARSSNNFGIVCRTYADSGRREGLPPKALIGAAIQEHR